MRGAVRTRACHTGTTRGTIALRRDETDDNKDNFKPRWKKKSFDDLFQAEQIVHTWGRSAHETRRRRWQSTNPAGLMMLHN